MNLEKKIYTSYFGYGIFDLILVAIIFGLGLQLIRDDYLGLFVTILATPILFSLYKATVHKRIGHLELRGDRKAKIGRASLLIYPSMVVGVGVGVVMFFSDGLVPPGFEAPHGLLLGLVTAVLIIVAGVGLDIARLSAYGVLLLIAMLAAVPGPIHPGTGFLIVGSILAVAGSLMLFSKWMRHSPSLETSNGHAK